MEQYRLGYGRKSWIWRSKCKIWRGVWKSFYTDGEDEIAQETQIQKNIESKYAGLTFEEYFYEYLLPQAIESGMTPEQALYEDVELMHIYFKAYNNKIEKMAWYGGLYDRLALVDVVSKVMSKDSSKTFDYPNLPLSMSDEKENVKTEQDKEIEFRQVMLSVYW